MNLRSLVLLLALPLALPLAAGCASGAQDDVAADSSGAAATVGLQGAERTAILDAVHARVADDFSAGTGLYGYRLVIQVRQLEADDTHAFLRGRLLKEDDFGKTHELTEANYAGTEFADWIEAGRFTGPEIIAGLVKQNGAWTIASKPYDGNTYTAYGMGVPTLGFEVWDKEFGLPKAWLDTAHAALAGAAR